MRPYYVIAYTDESGNYHYLNELYKIHSFEFDEHREKDSLLKFQMHTANLDVLEEPAFRTGEILQFSFGYDDSDWDDIKNRSYTHMAEVVDFDFKIQNNGQVIASVSALDMGHYVKKNLSKMVWVDMTASQIANQIANSYAFKEIFIDDTEHVYKEIAQGGRSDFMFLSYLASKEENIHYYIRDNTFHFADEEKEYDKKPAITLDFGNPDSRLQYFKAKIKKSDKDNSATEVSASTINQKTGETTEAKSDTSKSSSLNNHPVYFDANKNKIKPAKQDNYVKGSNHTTPEKDPKRIQAEINKKNKKAKRKGIEATISSMGRPDLNVGDLLTIGGLGKFSGNYMVQGANHKISTSGYMTTLQVTSDATKKAHNSDEKSKKKNTQTGDAKKDTRKEIKAPSKQKETVSFDANSNELNS